MALGTITCPECGNSAPAVARFCPECGRSLVTAFAGRGEGPVDESAQDITPTTAPDVELTPQQPTLDEEIERADIEDHSGGEVPTYLPGDDIPEEVIEDMTQPASYAPPPPAAYSTAPAQAAPEYSRPETPRYASAPQAAGQYVQYGAPAETRDISRAEVPYVQAPPPGYGQAPYPPQYGYARPKDPTIGLLLELIGLFGVLGIGHIYAGKVTRGVILMGSFFMYFIVFACLSIVLIGIPFLLLYWVVPIISALYLRNEMERELRQGYQQRY